MQRDLQDGDERRQRRPGDEEPNGALEVQGRAQLLAEQVLQDEEHVDRVEDDDDGLRDRVGLRAGQHAGQEEDERADVPCGRAWRTGRRFAGQDEENEAQQEDGVADVQSMSDLEAQQGQEHPHDSIPSPGSGALKIFV